eukprot:SAG31_NODE_984_length_10552_cov_4.679231_10_plen_67_part_00
MSSECIGSAICSSWTFRDISRYFEILHYLMHGTTVIWRRRSWHGEDVGQPALAHPRPVGTGPQSVG